MKSIFQYLSVVLISIVLITGCSTDGQTAVATLQPSTDTPQMAGIQIPNLTLGEQAWHTQQCDACHGPIGMGGIGPALAATPLEFEDFLTVVRTAKPPKPAFSEDMISEKMVYNIYAWIRTQQPAVKPSVPTEFPTFEAATAEDAMGMTIWTSRHCVECHGVFAQGGPKAPTLAGLNYPVAEELTRMRQAIGDVPEHSVDNIDDQTFEKLYRWLQAGCSYTEDCAQ